MKPLCSINQVYSFSILLLFVCSIMLSSIPVLAQPSVQYRKMYLTPNANGVYELAIYKSGVIQLEKPAKRISVGNPGIADILILRNKELYIVGKALGSTNIAVWDNKRRIMLSFDIIVTHDLDNLKLHLYKLMPDEMIEVRSARERIILSGEVSNIVKMKAAVELAESFLSDCIKPDSANQECKDGQVVNLMQVGGAHQVMLEVKIAEVSRQLMRKLDSQFKFFNFGKSSGGIISGGASFPNALTPQGNLVPALGTLNGLDSPIGPPVQLFQPGVPSIDDKGIFFSHLGSDYFVQAVIEASKSNGLGKILAEPTLVTLTGQQAKFLSGGEFPIPVPGDDGQVTIEFKEFGVGLKFLPVVLDSGRINMKLNVDVSEISGQNSIVVDVDQVANAFFIPSLTRRSAESTVELSDGQTIGIAGLLSDNVRAVVDRLPGLGDVPLLGALFSSQEFISGQTELVIFVTPHLAQPIDPEKIRLPADFYLPPSDFEFYLLGRLEARDKKTSEEEQQSSSSISTTSEAQGLDNSIFGHSL